MTLFFGESYYFVEQGNAMRRIHPDFSKPFDKISYKRLVDILVKHGLDPAIVRWFCNWSTDHTPKLGSHRPFRLALEWPQATLGGPSKWPHLAGRPKPLQ